MKLLLFSLALPIGLMAQSTCSLTSPCLTLLPQAAVKSTVPWAVTLCAPSDMQLPVGRIYQVMVSNGITPLTYNAAISALVRKEARSKWAKVATYAGWAAAGVAVLLSVKGVQANPQIQEGVEVGSGFLNALVPLAQKQEPTFANLISQIARDSDVMHSPVGGCSTTFIIGSAGKAINVGVQ